MNKNKLVLLARFATRARQFIGVVSVTKMCTDQAYALRIILSAKASKNTELIELAKKLSQTLIFNHKLLDAIDHFLEEYIEVEALPKVEYYIQIFSEFIYQASPENGEYRDAVNQFLSQLDAPVHPFCTQMIRAFHPYWKAEFNCDSTSDGVNLTGYSQPTKSLLDLWEESEADTLSIAELAMLYHFKTQMARQVVSSEAVDVRQRFAKILTVELRKYHAKSHIDYRQVVEKIRAIINKHELKDLFVQVSRDFYSYWESTISHH